MINPVNTRRFYEDALSRHQAYTQAAALASGQYEVEKIRREDRERMAGLAKQRADLALEAALIRGDKETARGIGGVLGGLGGAAMFAGRTGLEGGFGGTTAAGGLQNPFSDLNFLDQWLNQPPDLQGGF